MTENYDQQCVTEAIERHSQELKSAVAVDHACRTVCMFGGTAAGLAIGLIGPPGVQPSTGLAGAMVGTMVGTLVCENLSGVDEAVKPPLLTHCETQKGSRR